MKYILGETSEDLILDTVEENREIVNALAAQARQSIYIFSQDLDAEIYDSDEFERHLFKFASEVRDAEIRILVQDSSRATRHSHRVIRLAQKLTSYITIKNPCEEFKNEASAFMTVDNVGYFYKVKGDRYNHHASANFMSPLRTEEINSLFRTIWDQSDIDPHARRIFL